MHLVGFIMRIYHDARSSECRMLFLVTYYQRIPLLNCGPSLFFYVKVHTSLWLAGFSEHRLYFVASLEDESYMPVLYRVIEKDGRDFKPL